MPCWHAVRYESVDPIFHMKINKVPFIATLFVIALASAPALHAVIIGTTNVGTDVTVFDQATGATWGSDTRIAYPYGVSSGPASSKISVLEDQEVRNGALQDERYDLEAVFFARSLNRLTILGQYNFRDGVEDKSWGQTWTSGDMMVDVSPFASPPQPPIGDPWDLTSINYVIKFDWDNATAWSSNQSTVGYSIYKRVAGDGGSWQDVFFPQFGDSNPWRYTPGGSQQALSSGTALILRNVGSVTSDMATSDNIPYAFLGTSERFALVIGQGATGIGGIMDDYKASHNQVALQEFGAKFTMYCGNDEILAFVTNTNQQVPDSGSTNLLLGIALLMFAGACRRK